MKLQGHAGDPCSRRDSEADRQKVDRSSLSGPEPEGPDANHWERKPERGGNCSWPKPPLAAMLAPAPSAGTQRSESQERDEQGPSPDEFRSCSIAKLRAKARDYEAEIHSTVAKAGWQRQLQAHAAAADVASDWGSATYCVPHTYTFCSMFWDDAECCHAVYYFIYCCLRATWASETTFSFWCANNFIDIIKQISLTFSFVH